MKVKQPVHPHRKMMYWEMMHLYDVALVLVRTSADRRNYSPGALLYICLKNSFVLLYRSSSEVKCQIESCVSKKWGVVSKNYAPQRSAVRWFAIPLSARRTTRLCMTITN